MNLKEAFRYQKFLDTLMSEATRSISRDDHCFRVTKTHLMKAANPDAEDVVEEVVPDVPFYPNDDVIRMMEMLVLEKQCLSTAIGMAKAEAGFDIDAAIEANKFRQSLAYAVKGMLRRNGSRRTERGSGYKFNNEGVQAPYYYNVEVVATEAFDRDEAKAAMLAAITESDMVSAEIDAALINTKVDYIPPWNVNESFDDVMAVFVSK
jgi:hypothetical protein